MLKNWLKRKQDDANEDDASAQKKPKAAPEAQSSTTTPIILGAITEAELQEALDFSSLETTEAILERFDLIGNGLLHGFHLVVRADEVETPFEIVELEFYLQKDGCHEDPFTHGSEEQKICGKWYFHRAPLRSNDSHRSRTSLTAYRSGSRKGMDLTIGASADTVVAPVVSPEGPSEPSTDPGASSSPSASLVRGGALLRGIRRVSDKKMISGPSLLVDEILRLSKAAEIPELVEQKWAQDRSAFGSRPTSLFLRPRNITPGQSLPVIYRSPRIGLDLSHPGTTTSVTHPRVVFIARPYRYFTHPELLTTNGRPQTFLGALRACLSTTCEGQGLDSVRLKKELMRISGLNESTVLRYIEHYKAGVDSGKLGDFVGSAGKGAGSSPATYLKMMGVLEKLRIENEKAK